MQDQSDDNENAKIHTLEHADTQESYRQLWWTIGVTVGGLALIAYFYL